jgi:hypothetical protein
MTQNEHQTPVKPQMSTGRALWTLFLFAAGLFWAFGGSTWWINRQVSSQMEDEYKMAVKDGSPMDICVHAGLVSAGYLQSGDQEKYREAKSTERSACRAAGLPE